MNNRELVNIEGFFEPEALRVLREIPHLAVTQQPTTQDRRPDAVLRFAGARTPIIVEFKQRANAATAWQLAQYARTHPDKNVLLIAGETTREAREILEHHGIAVVDGLGNAHIALPGLLLHLEGTRRAAARGNDGPIGNTDRPPTRLAGRAGLAAEALLLNKNRAWHVTDLAEEAGVSAGLAHRVLVRLGDEGLVEAEGAGPKRVRRVKDAAALLDLWAEENGERPTRTLGYFLAPTPRGVIEELGTRLEHSGLDYAVTGAAAASLVAPFVTAIPVVEIWVTNTAARTELFSKTGVEPVANGQNVVFLQGKDDAAIKFRQRAEEISVVNPFRLFVDLRRDPRRGREQAEHLRREVIGF